MIDPERMTSLLMVVAAGAVAVPLECGLYPKALEMAERGYVSYFHAGGLNSRVINAGYPLDQRYEMGFANPVQAVAGYDDAHVVWRAFKASLVHRRQTDASGAG